MYIRVNYGILVSYYGFIEIGKNGYTNISIETVDLSDNSLAQQENFMATAAIQGNWKGGEEYEMLQSAIEQSTRNAIGLFYRKF